MTRGCRGRAHAAWEPGPTRPIRALLHEQETNRVAELVPLRHERMLASPFTFYRGAAVIMATDLGAHAALGLRVQVCGDAHLANFGGFASPERELVFDINDFDETNPGPFEWDVKRLAASFEIAARAAWFSAKETRSIVNRVVTKRLPEAMRAVRGHANLDVWYRRLDVEKVSTGGPRLPRTIKRFEKNLAQGGGKEQHEGVRQVTRWSTVSMVTALTGHSVPTCCHHASRMFNLNSRAIPRIVSARSRNIRCSGGLACVGALQNEAASQDRPHNSQRPMIVTFGSRRGLRLRLPSDGPPGPRTQGHWLASPGQPADRIEYVSLTPPSTSTRIIDFVRDRFDRD